MPHDPHGTQIIYSPAEVQFQRAMDQYKRLNRRPFPTWHEALAVLLSLGYRQVEEPGPLPKLERGKKP